MRRFTGLLFLGAGEISVFEADVLRERLNEAISISGGLQQELRPEPGDESDEEIELYHIVKDIAAALVGYNIEFTDKLPYPGKTPCSDGFFKDADGNITLTDPEETVA